MLLIPSFVQLAAGQDSASISVVTEKERQRENKVCCECLKTKMKHQKKDQLHLYGAASQTISSETTPENSDQTAHFIQRNEQYIISPANHNPTPASDTRLPALHFIALDDGFAPATVQDYAQ